MAFSTDSTISNLGLYNRFNNGTSCQNQVASATGTRCSDKNAKYLCTKNGKRVKKRGACRKVKTSKCSC